MDPAIITVLIILIATVVALIFEAVRIEETAPALSGRVFPMCMNCPEVNQN